MRSFPFASRMRHMPSDDHASQLHPVTRRVGLIFGWALVLLIIYLSLTPDPVELPGEQGDKVAHALAYFVLMSWFSNLYEGAAAHAICAAGCIALAVGLEFVQRWTGFRTFEVADMAAGATGVAVAWTLAPPQLPNYLHVTEKLWRAWRRA